MNRREALAALVAMPEIARIHKASLQPADVIVVECQGMLSQHTSAHMSDKLKEIWPDHKVVILQNGVSLKVVSGA